MVNRGATKEHQRSKIEAEVDRLRMNCNDGKTPIAVFSMNPSNDDVSFESGFLVD